MFEQDRSLTIRVCVHHRFDGLNGANIFELEHSEVSVTYLFSFVDQSLVVLLVYHGDGPALKKEYNLDVLNFINNT